MLCQVETLQEKIISLELSNAEEEVDSGKMEMGGSDAESESEEITGHDSSVNMTVESSDSLICTSPSQSATLPAKTEINTAATAAKKKKRKRSKKGRNWGKTSVPRQLVRSFCIDK